MIDCSWPCSNGFSSCCGAYWWSDWFSAMTDDPNLNTGDSSSVEATMKRV
jgi:hypothetical protein